jgi:hypothetical protein
MPLFVRSHVRRVKGDLIRQGDLVYEVSNDPDLRDGRWMCQLKRTTLEVEAAAIVLSE